MEILLGTDPPLIQEAWQRIKGWYKAAVDCAPPPARVTLKRIMAERVELYSYVPPTGKNIPISVQLLPVEDSVPVEDKIEWAVKRLRNNRSWGRSGCGQSTLSSVEQAIELLTIVIIIYEFAMGEFPVRARSAYSCMFKCSAMWNLIHML